MQRGSGIPARLQSGRGRRALALALLIACVAPAHAARPALAAIDSLWTAGQVDACWARLRDAIVEARAAGDRAYLLDLLVRRGSWRARLGSVAEAEPDLREAIDLAVSAGTGEPQRECLRWLGFALYRQGRALEARTCWDRLALEPYQESLVLFRACDDPRGAAYVQNGLGTVLQALGRYDEALAQYQRTVEAARALPLGGLRGDR